MILCLKAQNKECMGYTPDWLRVAYRKNNQLCEITFDIRGSIDFKIEKFSCRCKGDLIPWTFSNCETGEFEEFDKYSEEELEEIFPESEAAEIIKNGDEFVVGIYPAPLNDNDEELIEIAEHDVFKNCQGVIEYETDKIPYFKKKFSFETELNI